MSAGKGSTVHVGDGKNVVFINGTTENITTGNGSDSIFALGSGSNNIALGTGHNWAFLHDSNNVVSDGAGTDSVWFGGVTPGANTVVPNAAGGTTFVYGFNNSDQISLAKILAGVSVSLTATALAPYITVSTTPEALFPTLSDTLVMIKGAGGTANVQLMNYNAGGLQGLLNHNVIGLPNAVTI